MLRIPDVAHDELAATKLKRKDYEKELRKLQVQLCQLQEWVKAKKLRVIIPFEGRDAAHLLKSIPFKRPAGERVRLPKRSTKGRHDDQKSLRGLTFVPERY